MGEDSPAAPAAPSPPPLPGNLIRRNASLSGGLRAYYIFFFLSSSSTSVVIVTVEGCGTGRIRREVQYFLLVPPGKKTTPAPAIPAIPPAPPRAEASTSAATPALCSCFNK